MTPRQNMAAVALEAVPGTLLCTFGIGHLYAGRIRAGLAIMLGYWALQALNVALIPFLIGCFTAPLTWLAFVVLAPTNVLSEGPGRAALPSFDR